MLWFIGIDPNIEALAEFLRAHDEQVIIVENTDSGQLHTELEYPFDSHPPPILEPIEALQASLIDPIDRPLLGTLPGFYIGKQMINKHTNRLHSRKQAKQRAKRKKA